MVRPLLLITILLVLFSSFAAATVDVVDLNQEYYLNGSSARFNFQFFNNSALLSNSSASCIFDVYRGNGSSLVSGNMSYVLNEFYYDVVGTDLSDVGSYSYIASCTAGAEVDSTTGLFFVNERGVAPDESRAVIVIIILLPLIFALLLVLTSLGLSDEHGILRVFLGFFAWIAFWVSLHFGLIALVEFYYLPALENLIGSVTYITGWLFFAIISYWFIYSIFKIFESRMEKKRERLNYG